MTFAANLFRSELRAAVAEAQAADRNGPARTHSAPTVPPRPAPPPHGAARAPALELVR